MKWKTLSERSPKTRILLSKHGYTSVPQRLKELEGHLAAGDDDAVVWAVSEATGGAGSLRDVILYAADAEATTPQLAEANAQLDALVREVERTAREAAARLGLRLVR
jgi:hypothetical protein